MRQGRLRTPVRASEIYTCPPPIDYDSKKMRFTLILAAVILAACGSTHTTHSSGTKELLDDTTGNAVSVVSIPLIFARESADVVTLFRVFNDTATTEID